MGNNKKLLIILLSLVVATVANATPTMSDCNKSFVAADVSPTTDAQVLFIPNTNEFTEPSNSHLAAIGAEILKPPADFTDSPHLGAKTLPPVPAALFMVLTGFLCVSLVKDRKVWLAALSSLLLTGQAGFYAIPQLAAHISSRKQHIQRKSPDNTACLHRLEDSCRLRSNIEGTQYIGLLHHLAGIPDRILAGMPNSITSTASLSLSAFFPLLSDQVTNHDSLRNKLTSLRTKDKFRVHQFAITHFSSLLIHATNCSALRTEQYIHISFSPAFIFENLPRGPPKSA